MIRSTSANPRPWAQNGVEPPLDELLSDPTTLALLHSDRLTDHDLRAAVGNAKRSVEARRRSTAFPDEGPASSSGREPGWLQALAHQDDDALLKRGVRRDQIARLRNEDVVEIEELSSMLMHVGLLSDDAVLPLSVRVDLYLTCAGCSVRVRCRTWLADRKPDAGYQAFCPNSWMIQRRRQQRLWQGEAPLAHGNRSQVT
jgi:hypothetical protein